jgi:TatD DNase family protein
MYINLHTHQRQITPGVTPIINCGYGFETVPDTGWFSIGLHPWRLADWDVEVARVWLDQLVQHPRVIAIGEAGLDTVTDTPWTVQEQAFELCIQQAIQHRLPLILHCVKAYDEVLHYRKAAEQQHRQAWIIHGFDKHPNTATMLLRGGFLLSFGRAILQSDSHAAAALQQMPDRQFFLETDGAEQISIEAVYEAAAHLRGVSVDILQQQLVQTFERVFRKNLP